MYFKAIKRTGNRETIGFAENIYSINFKYKKHVYLKIFRFFIHECEVAF